MSSVEDNCRVARGAIGIVDDAAEYFPTLNRAGVMRLSARYRDLLPNTLIGASHSVIIVDNKVTNCGEATALPAERKISWTYRLSIC